MPSEWYEPFTEAELEDIEAVLESVSKRPRLDSSGDSGGILRRLPNSFLAPSPCRDYSKMRYPAMKFGGCISYSRTAAEVEKAAIEVLKTVEAKKREGGQAVLGFDIEWRPTFRKGVPPGKAAVLQICSDTINCHVMHIIHSGISPSLQLLLENSALLKVGVGIGNDAGKVLRDYNVSVKGVQDLSSLANQKLGGGAHKWSLASLTEKLVCKQLMKPNKIRLGNWEADLSKEQLQYAATDAFTSWYLYEVLKELPDIEEDASSGCAVDLRAV